MTLIAAGGEQLCQHVVENVVADARGVGTVKYPRLVPKDAAAEVWSDVGQLPPAGFRHHLFTTRTTRTAGTIAPLARPGWVRMSSPLSFLPVRPLLTAFRRSPPELAASPHADWLAPAAFATLSTADLATRLREFVGQLSPVVWHAERIAAQAGFVRHGIQHLLHGTDGVGLRFGRCATPGGTYAVLGAGRSFWAAVWKAAHPDDHPHWTAAVQRGLERCGLLDSRAPDPLAEAAEVYHRLRAEFPPLDATDLDQFFRLVSRTAGRELATADVNVAEMIRHRLRTVRTKVPLRGRLKDADPSSRRVSHSIPGGVGTSGVGAGLAALDDAFSATLPHEAQHTLFADVTAVLRERFAVHPLEAADVIAACAPPDPPAADPRPTFHGFATETFRFLAELTEHNEKAWMDAHRERYQFFVREPLVELCAALAERYVGPVLHREHGWEMETDPRPGRALTSIAKNDYGRGGPYTPDVWVTFYRRASGGKRHDAQLFVRVSDTGVSFGFHLGKSAREAGRRFRKAVQEHGEALFQAVRAGGCTFRGATTVHPVTDAAGLRAWAAEKELFAESHLPPDHPLLRSDDLVGEILIAFDRLVPLLAAALDDDPRPTLARRGGQTPAAPPFDRAAFRRATFLGDTWLSRALDLLSLKKQLILHGVPGTGKTHVARSLARLLTDDRPGGVRLVQFHPGYSYEEFVEGIRPRSVEANGRTEITYPVEPGVLSEFAAEAEANPALPFVLIVDEINRGNLPRIFGELLFLLEYRDQAVTLPHSKRPFRLPSNLLLLGTMNSADRSTVALDQALRRRFSFVEMQADAAVLAAWLEAQTSGGGDGTFAPRVVKLFDELNRRLARDLGPDRQIGHSFFMVPGLNEEQLHAVWQHHVLPTLAEYFAHRPVPSGYDFHKLFGGVKRKGEVV
ncbi:MAG: DUF2461 family protein [Fimbriiglobus sp.]|nr:DUF2461 family protein [Fimbriiglobus sp.]